MPLISLKTNLKSLRYGKDRPGGGSSKQPFIQVNKKNSFDLPVSELGQSGFGTDFLLRGGTLSLTNSAKDVSRIFKLFTETTTGLTFTGKQNALALLGQKFGAGGPTVPISSEGVYLPTSTLAQVAVNAFGGHANKQGVNPFPISFLGLNLTSGGRPTYLDYMYNPLVPAENPDFNRLVYLSKTAPINTSGTLFTYDGGPGAPLGIGKTIINFSQGNRTGRANPNLGGDVFLTQQFFAPEVNGGTYDYSVFKRPATSLNYFNIIGTNGASGKFAKLTGKGVNNNINNLGQRLGSNNVYTQGNTFPDVDASIVTNNNAATLTQVQIEDKTPVSKGGSFSDFRKEIRTTPEALGVDKVNAAKQSGMLTDAPDYSNPAVRLEQRVNLGDPGRKGANRSNYTVGIQDHAGGALDSLNALYLYKSDNVTTDNRKNDLVKFRIAIIDPDQPNSKTFAHFRAFIGGISDSYGADWSSYKYLGRGEEFFNYTGFNRTFSINWRVVAQSKQELSVMYQKLNYLASSLTPNFSSQGFMRGNIAQLSIGGYFYEQPGIITSLTYTVPDDSTWEIGIPATPSQNTSPQGGPDFSDSNVKELAHMIDVSMTFKPIHKFLPQIVGSALTQTENPFGVDGGDDIKQRYINLADSSEDNNLYSTTNLGRFLPSDWKVNLTL